MFDIQNYGSFVAAVVVFQLIPGPGTVTILTATARSGPTAGMGAMLGTVAGDFVFMLAAVLGLAAVLAAHPLVLSSLQWIGIAYLVWLGLKLLRTTAAPLGRAELPRLAASSWVRQAFAVSLTNPKVSLFFLAFFPLFLKPGSPASTLATMMAHVTLISLLYQSILVVVGNSVVAKLSRSPYAAVAAKRLAGLTLIGFAIRLATNRR